MIVSYKVHYKINCWICCYWLRLTYPFCIALIHYMRKGLRGIRNRKQKEIDSLILSHFVDWLFKILLILQCKSIRKKCIFGILWIFWIFDFFDFLGFFGIFWDFFEKIRGCTRIFSSWQPLERPAPQSSRSNSEASINEQGWHFCYFRRS
jgi:hypothetical protein